MKGEINLLPTGVVEQRTALLYLDQMGRIFRWSGIGAAIVVAVLVTSLVISYRLTENFEAQIEAQAVAEPLTQLEDSNNLLTAVTDRLAVSPSTAGYLPAIVEALPTGTHLSRLEYLAADQSLEITGVASQRQNIVKLETALRDLPGVVQVTAPLSNFRTGDTNQFTLIVHYAAGNEESVN